MLVELSEIVMVRSWIVAAALAGLANLSTPSPGAAQTPPTQTRVSVSPTDGANPIRDFFSALVGGPAPAAAPAQPAAAPAPATAARAAETTRTRRARSERTRSARRAEPARTAAIAEPAPANPRAAIERTSRSASRAQAQSSAPRLYTPPVRTAAVLPPARPADLPRFPAEVSAIASDAAQIDDLGDACQAVLAAEAEHEASAVEACRASLAR
jgi:ribonuclease E